MNPRDRRALAIGAAVVAAAVLCLRVLPELGRGGMERWGKLETASLLLARTESELAAASALEDSAKVVRASLTRLAPKLLAGRTEADAAADLAARIGHVCTQHGVRLERTAALPDSARAGWIERVTVSAQMEGDMKGVAGLLAGLAAGSPVVVTQGIRLVASPEATARGPERLRLELVTRGWYLAQAAR